MGMTRQGTLLRCLIVFFASAVASGGANNLEVNACDVGDWYCPESFALLLTGNH